MCLVHCDFSPIVRVTPLSQDGPRLVQRDHQESSRQKPLPEQVVFSCEHTSYLPILYLGKEPKPFPEDMLLEEAVGTWVQWHEGVLSDTWEVTGWRRLVSRAGLRAEPTVLIPVTCPLECCSIWLFPH